MLTLCVALAACGADGDSSGERSSDALEQWRSKEPRAYTFVYSRGCYCASNFVSPVRVVIVDGQVVSARFADGQDAASRRATIADLHREILGWVDKRPAELRVRYDETWAYPVEAHMDRDEGMADDEQSLGVSCFAPNAEDDACPLSATE